MQNFQQIPQATLEEANSYITTFVNETLGQAQQAGHPVMTSHNGSILTIALTAATDAQNEQNGNKVVTVRETMDNLYGNGEQKEMQLKFTYSELRQGFRRSLLIDRYGFCDLETPGVRDRVEGNSIISSTQHNSGPMQSYLCTLSIVEDAILQAVDDIYVKLNGQYDMTQIANLFSNVRYEFASLLISPAIGVNQETGGTESLVDYNLSQERSQQVKDDSGWRSQQSMGKFGL